MTSNLLKTINIECARQRRAGHSFSSLYSAPLTKRIILSQAWRKTFNEIEHRTREPLAFHQVSLEYRAATGLAFVDLGMLLSCTALCVVHVVALSWLGYLYCHQYDLRAICCSSTLPRARFDRLPPHTKIEWGSVSTKAGHVFKIKFNVVATGSTECNGALAYDYAA